MNQQKQLELTETLNAELIVLFKSKGADYADEDVLSNFKTVSAAVKNLKIDVTTPVGYSMLMVLLKIARINNLLSDKKKPSNESIEDSFKDGINYFKLSYLCYKDTTL